MSGPPPQGVPPDVAALLASERAIPPAPGGARARVAERLGLAAAPTAPLHRWTWPGGTKVVFLMVALAGGAAWVVSRPTPTPVVPAAPPVPVAPALSPPRPATPELAPAPASAASSPRSPAAETEVALLRRARRALTAGDAAQALSLLERHRHRWPAGELLQEREVLAIQALVAKGAVDEARRRADAFLTRFPTSTLAPSVQRLREN